MNRWKVLEYDEEFYRTDRIIELCNCLNNVKLKKEGRYPEKKYSLNDYVDAFFYALKAVDSFSPKFPVEFERPRNNIPIRPFVHMKEPKINWERIFKNNNFDKLIKDMSKDLLRMRYEPD